MHVEIITRNGSLEPEQLAHLQEKAQKLPKYFERLMAVEVEAVRQKLEWEVGILVSAEHKHDFVARHADPSVLAAMDQCVHKIEEQLRRYKERVQHHKGDPGTSQTPNQDEPNTGAPLGPKGDR